MDKALTLLRRHAPREAVRGAHPCPKHARVCEHKSVQKHRYFLEALEWIRPIRTPRRKRGRWYLPLWITVGIVGTADERCPSLLAGGYGSQNGSGILRLLPGDIQEGLPRQATTLYR